MERIFDSESSAIVLNCGFLQVMFVKADGFFDGFGMGRYVFHNPNQPLVQPNEQYEYCPPFR